MIANENLNVNRKFPDGSTHPYNFVMASGEFRDPTQRFSDRAENYRKYRPGYPPQIYDYLHKQAGLERQDVIADLGSGTGLLSSLFLRRGHEVYGIEPNEAMRKSAEEDLAEQQNFKSINGRAESIPLPDASVDFVVAGQAFHWFEPKATRVEVKRILKPGRQTALIWNNRRIELNPFHRDYEQLLGRFGIDYAKVARRWMITNEEIAAWFAPHPMVQASFPNSKHVDAEGLRGGLLSASYIPTEGHPNYQPMLEALDELFARYQAGGFVQIEYKTMVYHGKV
jgi:ubiquinone/menaquinone biosynthesis C-methylase UbiE